MPIPERLIDHRPTLDEVKRGLRFKKCLAHPDMVLVVDLTPSGEYVPMCVSCKQEGREKPVIGRADQIAEKEWNMTTKALAAKPQTLRCKLKSVDEGRKPDGTASYSVTAFPPYRDAFSQYPVQMFIWGRAPEAEASELYGAMKKLDAGTVVTLDVVPGKLRVGKDGIAKPDDGQFGNYYWNVVGMAGLPGAPKAAEAQEATQDEAAGPSMTEEGPFAEASQRPTNWDATQTRIGVSWAIDQARQTLLVWNAEPPADGDWGPFLKDVSVLAPRFIALRDYLVAKAMKGG